MAAKGRQGNLHFNCSIFNTPAIYVTKYAMNWKLISTPPPSLSFKLAPNTENAKLNKAVVMLHISTIYVCTFPRPKLRGRRRTSSCHYSFCAHGGHHHANAHSRSAPNLHLRCRVPVSEAAPRLQKASRALMYTCTATKTVFFRHLSLFPPELGQKAEHNILTSTTEYVVRFGTLDRHEIDSFVRQPLQEKIAKSDKLGARAHLLFGRSSKQHL